MPLDDQLNRRLAQHPGHPAENVQLCPFDVDLDHVHAAIHHLVQRRDGHLRDSSDCRVDALLEQAVDAAGLSSQKQITNLAEASRSDLVDLDVVEPVCGDIVPEDADVVGSGLEGHDPAGAAAAPARVHGVVTDVRAYVDDSAACGDCQV